MNSKKIQKYLLKLKESFLVESDENIKMLDIYVKYIEGKATQNLIPPADLKLDAAKPLDPVQLAGGHNTPGLPAGKKRR